MGLLKVEKKDYQIQIEDLCRQVQNLNYENIKLREESMNNYPVLSDP
jgi:hypothetical protein